MMHASSGLQQRAPAQRDVRMASRAPSGVRPAALQSALQSPTAARVRREMRRAMRRGELHIVNVAAPEKQTDTQVGGEAIE
jgi:hypothetical protein